MNRSVSLLKICNNIIIKKQNIQILSNINKNLISNNNNIQQTRNYFKLNKISFSQIPPTIPSQTNNNNNNNEKKDEINTTTTTTTTTTNTTTPITQENELKNNTTTTEENKQENKQENNNENNENNNNNNNNTEEPPKTLKEKIISKIKWTTIIGSVAGSIFFLFYESYLRNTMPYRMTMLMVDRDVDVLREFGGHITGIKWYKCFINPIFGWMQNEEGGFNSWTILKIPITRYVPPPPPTPKDGKPLPPIVELPEDALFKGYDGGAQEGTIYVRFNKSSANFFDWEFEDLQVVCDNDKTIKIVDSEKNKVKL